jgi:Cu+-exporting ATPase
MTAKLRSLFIDKTGTVTLGKMKLQRIETLKSYSEDEVLKIAAAAETGSAHPYAEAVIAAARDRQIDYKQVQSFSQTAGRGVEARVDGHDVKVGSISWLQEQGIQTDGELLVNHDQMLSEGLNTFGVTKDDILIGILGLADEIRPTSIDALRNIHELGLKATLLSGDRTAIAKRTADLVGFKKVVAEVRPEDKVAHIKEAQDKGTAVGMVGDGVNDAPALAQADVGFAIGTGSDVAIETGDVILMGVGLEGVVVALRHARRTVGIIKQNLFWAFFYNSLGIPLAAGLFYPLTGWMLPPVFAAAAMALSSVSVVSNSLRLRKIRS